MKEQEMENQKSKLTKAEVAGLVCLTVGAFAAVKPVCYFIIKLAESFDKLPN
jgi:hypothetical protein